MTNDLDKRKCRRSALCDGDLVAINREMGGKTECYCHRSNLWTHLHSIDCITYFSSELIDEKLIVIGGRQVDGTLLDLVNILVSTFRAGGLPIMEVPSFFQVYSLDIVTNNRMSLQPMKYARYCHSTITLDGSIYAFGGICYDAILGTTETAERQELIFFHF